MNSFEKQKRHDFVQDLKLLSDQYGWTLDEAIDIIGFKQKTNSDLLLEKAKEKYTVGVVFYPLNKMMSVVNVDEGNPYWISDNIWIDSQGSGYCIYDGFKDKWAKIIKD